MIKRMWNWLGKYRKMLIISVLLVILEIVFDLTIPVLMSDIIDNGIQGGAGVGYVIE